jgi:hypothetical protein
MCPGEGGSSFFPLLLFIILSVVRQSTWYCGHYWPIVPAQDDRWWWLWSNWWNEDWQGKPKYSERTCSSATLSTNPTRLDPGSKPGRCGEKPASNHLSHNTSHFSYYGGAELCNGGRPRLLLLLYVAA